MPLRTRSSLALVLGLGLVSLAPAGELPREYLRDVQGAAMQRSPEVREALRTLMQDREFFGKFVTATSRLRRKDSVAAPVTSMFETAAPSAPSRSSNPVGASPDDNDWIEKAKAWREKAEEIALQYAKFRLQQEVGLKGVVKEMDPVKVVGTYAVMTDEMKTTGRWQVRVEYAARFSTFASKIVSGLDVVTKVLTIGFLKASDLCGRGLEEVKGQADIVVDLPSMNASSPDESCWIER